MWGAFVFLIFIFSEVYAQQEVELSFVTEYEVADWQFKGKKRPQTGVEKELYDLANLASSRKYKPCLDLTHRLLAQKETSLFHSWIRTKKLFCLSNLYKKKQIKAAELKSYLEELKTTDFKSPHFGAFVKMKEYFRGAEKSLGVNKTTKVESKRDKEYLSLKGLYKKKSYKSFLDKAIVFLLKKDILEQDLKGALSRLSWLGYSLTRGKIKPGVLKWESYLKKVAELSEEQAIYIAKYLRGKAKYEEAAQVAELTLGDGASGDAYLQAGFSRLLKGDYEKGALHLKEAIAKAKDPEVKSQAQLRLGLIHYRLQRNNEALKVFDEALKQNEASIVDMRLKYWRLAVLTELKSPRLALLKSQFIARYPMTYYGLKLQVQEGQIRWAHKPAAPGLVKMNWKTQDVNAFERFKLFLKAGLIKDAERELRLLPPGETGKQNMILASLWKPMRNYFERIKYIAKAWDLDSSLMREPYLTAAFPQKYSKDIKLRAQRNQLHPALIRGLIRQESSYHEKAVSSSNARGLMQLIPSTAREMSRRLKRRRLRNADLFSPPINIRLGTYYLKTRLKAFKGHLPLALASYNVGIGNIRKWMAARPETQNLDQTLSSDFRSEIWIDELPWSETSFYVKAVLRNYFMYRLLEEKNLTLPSVVWADAVVMPAKKAKSKDI